MKEQAVPSRPRYRTASRERDIRRIDGSQGASDSSCDR